MRIGIVEYRDIEEDGMDSTIIHELNHSLWMNSTSEMVEVLNGISAGGGGDDPETVIDGLGYLVDGETIPWSSDCFVASNSLIASDRFLQKILKSSA